MKKVSDFLVEKRTPILIVFLILTAVCAGLFFRININADMTRYMPDDSPMKTGTDIMLAEFLPATSFNLMIDNLSDAEKADIKTRLEDYDSIQTVTYEQGSPRFNADNHTLYILTLNVNSFTPEVNETVAKVKSDFADYDIAVSGEALGNNVIAIIPKIAGIAMVVLIIILFIMCNSWIEPFLFLTAIAVAIVLNMGTNALLPSVSDVTMSIAAVLQLVLSMDYSIMLLNRYRDEKKRIDNKYDAMKSALTGAMTAISASSVTTITGMLALCFMSFTFGMDLGIVLAKGVFFSLLCIFTVLPALILAADGAIAKTAKPSLHIKMGAVGRFSYKFRYFITGAFVILFAISFALRGNVGIAYTMSDYFVINEIFPLRSTVVAIYENTDEEAMAGLVEKWSKNPDVAEINAYGNTLGKKFTAAELSEEIKNMGGDFSFDSTMLDILYYQYFTGDKPQMLNILYFMKVSQTEPDPSWKLSIDELFEYVSTEIIPNPVYAEFIDDETKSAIAEGKKQMDEGRKALVSDRYSRVIISLDSTEESPETFAFLDQMGADMDSTLKGEHFTVGSAAMANEMSVTFPPEFDFITILTAIAIFTVIAIAFKSLSIPLILVCIIQCAVFVTMSITAAGDSVYYLSLLVVNCLLMGAAVDYGIIFTSYYRECRGKMPVKESVTAALNMSIHTIFTSALILVSITGIVGVILLRSDPAISSILGIIALGAFAASMLVIFILPGILAALDRFIVKGKK
jgi:predicted RND superfamily exporter protein